MIKPPHPVPIEMSFNISLFLGGSIEMGKATDWQSELETKLKYQYGIILNPRRDNWNPEWEQSIDSPHFYEQVTWELDALDKADRIIFYFEPGTLSPISLMELGLYAASNKCHVICPEGFWRKGNVDIVCERYSIPTYDSIDHLLKVWIGSTNDSKK